MCLFCGREIFSVLSDQLLLMSLEILRHLQQDLIFESGGILAQ